MQLKGAAGSLCTLPVVTHPAGAAALALRMPMATLCGKWPPSQARQARLHRACHATGAHAGRP